mgnify:CR=1 FL=1
MRHLWGTTLSTARKHRERGPGRSQPEKEAGAEKRGMRGGAEDTRTPRPGAQNGAGGSPAPPRESTRRSGAHGTLVSGHQVDATLVALIPTEGSLEESNDESQDLFLAVLTSTDRHHVCVVMLTS